MDISVIGMGTVGSRLAELLLENGHTVYFGVRDPAKIDSEKSVFSIKDAISFSKVVIFAVPFTAYGDMLSELKNVLIDKIVVDASNPLNEDWSPLVLENGGSAGEVVAESLPSSKVVKAFNTVFADIMTEEGLQRGTMKATAFIAGDDEEAVSLVQSIAADIGFDPLNVGPMMNARYLEAMAHLNIQIAVGQGGGTGAAFLYSK